MGLNSGALRGPLLNPRGGSHHATAMSGGVEQAQSGSGVPPSITAALFGEMKRISASKLKEIVEASVRITRYCWL